MSEGPPRTRTRRPETARPRHATDEHGEQEAPSPPSFDELERIERHLAGLAESAGAIADPGAVAGCIVLRWPHRGPAFNHAATPRWTEAAWSAAVAEVARLYVGAGETPAIVVADGVARPPGLGARLREAGWVRLTTETVLWTRRAAVVPHLDPAIRIEAVTPNAVATYEPVEREIFGVAPAEARDRVPALERGIASGSLRAYLVRLGGEPVATARLATAPGLAALHGVGVVERFRGQGYGRLITTIVTRAGLALSGPGGLVWLSVAPHNGAARALYDSLDYRPAFDWELFISAAAV